MYYIDEKNFEEYEIDWSTAISTIEESVKIYSEGDYSQPVKPYLRYRDLNNRIIAMPAFIGGQHDISGIKWIASFPNNIDRGLPRAHSVVVLNESSTGVPLCIINTPKLSIVRTSSVSGLLVQKYLESLKKGKVKVGITGFGPIGQHHLLMLEEMFSSRIESYKIFDLRKIELPGYVENKAKICGSWEECYTESDIFITCTVSKERYINLDPKPGSLQLNVSLRDYMPSIYDSVKDSIIVDNWDEICRENTDIEYMHKKCGLSEDEVYTIEDIVNKDVMSNFVSRSNTIMFNPMGMAIFDMSIAKFIWETFSSEGVGKKL